MTDDTQQQLADSNELETLKNRANLMGLKYHHNIGLAKLRSLVNGSINQGEEDNVKGLLEDTQEYLTGEEYQKIISKEVSKDVNKLVRIRITCMNPAKKDWTGEIISVGSSKLGTYKKFIPYNTPDGWHVPKIIYEFLKDRECSIFYSVKDKYGNDLRKSKRVKEYAIEVLPPLTKQELKDLAQRQAMARGTDGMGE